MACFRVPGGRLRTWELFGDPILCLEMQWSWWTKPMTKLELNYFTPWTWFFCLLSNQLFTRVFAFCLVSKITYQLTNGDGPSYRVSFFFWIYFFGPLVLSSPLFPSISLDFLLNFFFSFHANDVIESARENETKKNRKFELIGRWIFAKYLLDAISSAPPHPLPLPPLRFYFTRQWIWIEFEVKKKAV